MTAVLVSQTVARSKLPLMTDLTQQSVHRLTDGLLTSNLLRLGKPVISGRGKPSPTLSVDPDHYVSVGVSVSTERIKYCVVDLSGQPLFEESMDGSSSDPAAVADVVAKKIPEWLDGIVAGRAFVGIGVAMQGFRNGQEDIFYPPVPLSRWSAIPLKKVFQDACSLPVFTANNASASALAEQYLGASRGLSCATYLSFNYGFGAGISWDRKAFLGGHGNAGEISALFASQDHPARPALGELIHHLNTHGVKLSTVSELSKKFDPTWPGLADWLDHVRPQIQSAVRALQATVDPEAIIFGGEAPNELRNMLIAISEDSFQDPRMPSPRLIASELTGDPAHIGAALLPLHERIF